MNEQTYTDKVLNVLSLEDSIPDFEILSEQIKSQNINVSILRVDTEKDFLYALQNNIFDIILTDFKLAGFDAFGALKLAKEICPETPVICISGYIGEETAIELIKNGAVDYILKDRLGRLTTAINRAIDEANEKKKRKLAVLSLHESEARLKNLIMNLPGYVYRCKIDTNWTLTYISDGCKQITGYSAEEFIEQKITSRDLVRNDYKDYLWTQYQLDQSQEKVFEQEYPIKTKNDEVKWLWERGRTVCDENDNPLYVEGFITDITERKELENEVAEHHATITAILESAAGPVFSVDTNYCYTTFNSIHASTMKSIFGVDIQIGHNMLDYFTVADDKEKAKKNLDRALKGEHFVDAAYSGDPGLKRLYFDISHNPIYDLDYKVIGVSVFAQDITYRKQMELTVLRNMKFTEKLLKSIPIPVFVKDKNGCYLGCNDAFTNHTGFTEEFIKGKTMIDLWPGEQSVIYHQRELQTLAGENHLSYEAKIIDKENRIRDAIYFKNVFYDESGIAAGIIGAFIDITERKKTEEEKRYLLALVDNVADRIVVKDLNLKIVAANKAWLKARGKNSIKEVFGLGDAEAFGLPFDEEPVRTWMEDENKVKALMEGEFIIKEQPIQLATGENTIAMVKRFPIYDNRGELFCLGTIATDITEHIREEEMLRKSEEKYRTVANYTNDWEFWINQHGDFVYCSPSCQIITGYSDSDFLNNSKLLSEIIYPDDRSFYESLCKKEDLGEQGHQEIQFRIVCLDGTIKWIGHVSRPIFNDFNEFIGIRGSNRDITERKEIEQQLIISNQKYKLLSENISDGIFISRNGLLEYVNTAMYQIFGYEDLELKDKKLIQLLEQESRSKMEQILSLNVPNNQSYSLDVKCLKKDQSTIYVELILNYVAAEKIIYGVAHDVTEKRQIHKKNIIKAIIQTEEKEKSYFSKELHDGLGPLLSTIKLYLQWSKRQDVDELREEIIQKAESILEEALVTVTEISNKLSPHLLQDYGLTSAVLSFTKKLNETSLLKIYFQSNLNRRVNIEIESALYRAVIECINNTIKHAKANNIYIVINDSGNLIQLNYKDDGIGFDIGKMITEQKGLGLFNLKNRIQTIGGNVKMKSEPGLGVDYAISINC